MVLPRQGGGKYRGLRFRFLEVDGAPRPPARPPGAVVLGRHSFLLNASAPISVMDVSTPLEIAQSHLTPGETAQLPQPLNPGEPGGLGLRPGAPRGRPRQGLIHLRPSTKLHQLPYPALIPRFPKAVHAAKRGSPIPCSEEVVEMENDRGGRPCRRMRRSSPELRHTRPCLLLLLCDISSGQQVLHAACFSGTREVGMNDFRMRISWSKNSCSHQIEVA